MTIPGHLRGWMGSKEGGDNTMTAQERATQFVRKYPNLFTEDQDWWIAEIGIMIIDVQREQLQADKEMALKIIREAKP